MAHPIHIRALVLAAILFALALSHASPVEAQRRGSDRAGTSGSMEETGRGYFQVGYLSLDPGALNAGLTDAGYPALADDFLTLGGGGLGRVGDRFLLGGEGHGVLGESITRADGEYRVSAAGGFGLFRVGYAAWSYRGFDLIPMVGIGGGGLSVDITGRSAPDFDEVLEDPARSSSLSTGMFLLDAALAAAYRVRVTERDRRDGDVGGLLLGVQAGYTFQPGGTSWTLDGINTVAGGPDFAIEGFYIRVSIGGWGSSTGERERRRRR